MTYQRTNPGLFTRALAIAALGMACLAGCFDPGHPTDSSASALAQLADSVELPTRIYGLPGAEDLPANSVLDRALHASAEVTSTIDPNLKCSDIRYGSP